MCLIIFLSTGTTKLSFPKTLPLKMCLVIFLSTGITKLSSPKTCLFNRQEVPKFLRIIACGPPSPTLKANATYTRYSEASFHQIIKVRMNSKELLQTKKHTFIEAHAYISSKGNNSTTLKQSMNDGFDIKNPISIPLPHSIHLVKQQ